MKEGTRVCKFCGREIGVITWGVYRKIVVDAEAVMVLAAEEGEEFVRIDGSKVRGREIGVITWGVYRKIVVDAEAVMVLAAEEGEEFVRIDGSKVRGREVEYEEAVLAEPAYRPHRKTCGG